MFNLVRHARLRPGLLRENGRAWLTAILLITVPVAGFAQETTSSVRGTVVTEEGSPIANATVVVTDTRAGTVRRTTTNENGSFAVRSLQVGGPYTVRVQSNDYQGALVTDVFTNLSGAASFDIVLGAQNTAVDEVTVVASQVATADLAIGPGTARLNACGFLYTSGEIVIRVPNVRDFRTPVDISIPVPNSPALLGATFYQQVVTRESTTFGPKGGIQLSRAGKGVIGR